MKREPKYSESVLEQLADAHKTLDFKTVEECARYAREELGVANANAKHDIRILRRRVWGWGEINKKHQPRTLLPKGGDTKLVVRKDSVLWKCAPTLLEMRRADPNVSKSALIRKAVLMLGEEAPAHNNIVRWVDAHIFGRGVTSRKAGDTGRISDGSGFPFTKEEADAAMKEHGEDIPFVVDTLGVDRSLFESYLLRTGYFIDYGQCLVQRAFERWQEAEPGTPIPQFVNKEWSRLAKNTQKDIGEEYFKSSLRERIKGEE